jgi:hypothetical protein
MTISVAQISPASYSPADNAAEEIVQQRFDDAQAYSDAAYQKLESLIDQLSEVFSGADMPLTDVEYTDQDASISSNITSYRPTPPSDLTPEDVEEPTRPSLSDITVPTVNIPDFDDINMPETAYSYVESGYTSELAEQVKEALLAWIEDGGTGLGAAVEAALWARALARQQSKNEKMYAEEENYFAARGHILPPGALSAGLREINVEIERANAQMNYEITIEQARLAQNNTQFTITSGLTMEAQDKEFFNQVANRALQSAKDAVQVIIDIFLAKVQERLGQYELAKTEAQVATSIVAMQADANRAKVDIYNADIEMFKANLTKELSIIETAGKVYGFQVAGYEADAKVEQARLDALIREFQARIEQEKAKTELSIKEAEIALQNYLGALNLNIETIKGAANIASQIAASALSGISASASIGDSFTRGISQTYSHGEQISNSAQITQSISE